MSRINAGCQARISSESLERITTVLTALTATKRPNASLTAKIISRFWMRIVWGYILGTLCHLGKKLIQRLKEYPIDEGSQHKQVVLQRTGFWQALMWGSEGGIDGSNMPYAYVCLPLETPYKMANEISQKILKVLKKRIFLIIVDTDKTYTFKN